MSLASGSELPRSQLRAIGEALDEAPLPSDWQWLCQFAARYYQHSLGDTMQHAMPARLRQGHPMAGRTQTLWLPLPNDETALARAPKQAELYALLRQHPHGLPGRAVSAHGFTREQLLGCKRRALYSPKRSLSPPLNPPAEAYSPPRRCRSTVNRPLRYPCCMKNSTATTPVYWKA